LHSQFQKNHQHVQLEKWVDDPLVPFPLQVLRVQVERLLRQKTQAGSCPNAQVGQQAAGDKEVDA
jgi:hypothetical protein